MGEITSPQATSREGAADISGKHRSMQNRQALQLIFEKSRPGKRSVRLPECDVPEHSVEALLPAEAVADTSPPLPELAEIDLVRHFTNLAMRNMSVDTHFYPLGSCTMKYNPKRNESLASLPGWLHLHPLQPDDSVQGQLFLLHELQQMLAEVSGLPAVCLQPAAGAHGELTALLVAAACFRDRGEGESRQVVLVPDSAHGTNPASATNAGFRSKVVRSNAEGTIDLDDLEKHLDESVAVLMITNPNTLGLFEKEIARITEKVHQVGGLVYLDGANMNAIAGIARPGDFGADMMHFNPHKTFSTPHGGGGPGAGPIAVSAELEPFLPIPRIVREDGRGGEGPRYRLEEDRPQSIGRVRAFYGNVGVLNRAYFYLRTLGPDGLREMSEHAVLNANYLLSRVADHLEVPFGRRCMHEFVASASRLKAEHGITAQDIGKRLLDYGFHAPTVYFPLIVAEALMMEPTETETKATLDAFAEAIREIVGEPGDMLQEAPHRTAIRRPDEVAAARRPVLSWKK
jgi:glycine dehydrogenase subunit 2